MNCPHCQIAYDPAHWESCPHCGISESGTAVEIELSGVLRTSTILIAAGEEACEIYRSVEEVPEPLRRMLVKSTNGLNSGTIYIADQRGREQMARAIRNLPQSAPAPVFSRLSSGTGPQSARQPTKRVSLSAVWFAVTIAAFAGGVIWLVGSRSW